MALLEKRLKRIINQYKAWTEDNSDYSEAIANPYFMNNSAHQRFQKQLRSGKDNAGWTAVMSISHRYAYFAYYGGLKLLSGEQDSWDYIDRAYDGEWMKFKIAHDGDIEAETAFMLAHSHLLGYQNRAHYLGNFFYRFEQDAKAREQLEHTDIPRLIAQLWAKSQNLPLEHFGSFLVFENENSGYAELVRGLYEPDCAEIQQAMRQALDFHIEQSAKESGRMCTSVAYYLFPVEILYFLKLREEKGLITALPVEHILWQAYEKIKPQHDYAAKLLDWDEALKLAFDKAVSQGFLQTEDWAFSYERV
jgi:hypothetical protein